MADQKPKILVAEDTQMYQDMISMFLSDEYDLVPVYNGQEAIDALERTPDAYAAFVLDLTMPVLGGFEVLEYIHKHTHLSSIPVLVATAEQSDETENTCFEAGAWDFIRKPYTSPTLRARLRNIIGLSNAALLDRVRHLAERDPLTNLYNRSFFFERTRMMLEVNPDTEFALIRMDYDNFKLFNSFYGSNQGDELLKKTANGFKLLKNITPTFTYGHITADVFCMCIPNDEALLTKIRTSAPKIFETFSSHYYLEASFGICKIDNADADLENVYAFATTAARSIKDDFSRSWCEFDSSMYENQVEAQRIANEMEEALEKGQFQVYIQPKYSINDNRPVGGEALVRWIHPERGFLSPGLFIPLFEQNGFITSLDRFMWEQVCVILRRWIDEGRNPGPISVNISRVSLYNPNIVDVIEQLVTKYDIEPRLLELEVTESSYMSNPELMERIIEHFHSHGFTILMDDFGSGYSSLNSLKDFDIDILKVDMKFLPSGKNNIKSEKILVSVVRMANWLGLKTVVEGVETVEQRDFLQSIGVDVVQGFYYSKPIPVSDFEGLVDNVEASRSSVAENDSSHGIDVDQLLSADGVSAALLGSIALPFALVEFNSADMEIIRMNDSFLQAFDRPLKRNLISSFLSPADSAVLYDAASECASSRMGIECEIRYQPAGSAEEKWYHVRFHYIDAAADSSYLSMTFTDITFAHKLEEELHDIENDIKPKERRSMLVVDDSDVTCEIFKAQFEDEFDVLTAANGREGLSLLKQKCDDVAVILLDLNMPILDGHGFLKEKNALEAAKEIPVIVISSDSGEDTQTSMLEEGINDYITKPFVPSVMARRVRNVLEFNSRFRTLVDEYKNRK